MCNFLRRLFKKRAPQYRIVKETRAVKESADGQNLTLQAFYLPQVKYRREWEHIPASLARPATWDGDDTLVYFDKDYYDRKDCQFENEELAKTMIECYTFSEKYRGYNIRKTWLKHYGKEEQKKDRVVWYIEDDEDDYSVRMYNTYDEVKEEVNRRNPQVVNSVTIKL